MKQICQCCGERNFQLLMSPPCDLMVTSDARLYNVSQSVYICKECNLVQKEISNEYLNILNSIYSGYNSQFILSGEDELIHTQKQKNSRSSYILENIKLTNLNQKSLLDVGSGSGVFLKSAIKKGLDCYAHDISKNHHVFLKDIIEEEKIYYGEIKEIPRKFDIISAIHVLEHVTDINKFISEVKSKLKKSGLLIIQVPDIEKNPFDLAILDHCFHFSQESLTKTIKKHFKFSSLPNNQIYKEITLLASDTPFKEKSSKHGNQDLIDIESIQSLYNLRKSISRPTDIFGTGSPSVLTRGLIGENANSFIDEDQRKIGKFFKGLNVNNTVSCDQIIIPFPRQQAKEIALRIKKDSKIIYPENI